MVKLLKSKKINNKVKLNLYEEKSKKFVGIERFDSKSEDSEFYFKIETLLKINETVKNWNK